MAFAAIGLPQLQAQTPTTLFFAGVEQFGTGSGQIDLFKINLSGGNTAGSDTFTANTPATLAVTNSTNEGKPDINNPADIRFDKSGDLLIANGGTSVSDPGSFACVPASAITTGANASTTITQAGTNPIATGYLAYDSRDGSAAISNNQVAATPQLYEYLLNGSYSAAGSPRNLTASGFGALSVTAVPSLAAGTYAVALQKGKEEDPSHGGATGSNKVAIFSPTGAETDIIDDTGFTVDEPYGITYDAQNTQLVIANNSVWHKLVSFYTATTTPTLVKSINTGHKNAYVAASTDGHIAVAWLTPFGDMQVQVYDNTAARNPVFGPIPYNGTTTSCGSTYIYGNGGIIVNGMRWLSNTKLLVAVEATNSGSSDAYNGFYIYDITNSQIPAGYDDVTCSAFAAAPINTGFVHVNTHPFAADIRGGTYVYADPGGTCSGNMPCYSSINTAIAALSTGGVVNVQGGTFNEAVTLNNANITVSINANTTVNSFTLTAGTLNSGGGSCSQASAPTLTLSSGNWTNNSGTFNPGGGTVAFTGSSAQSITGATTFNNLTNSNTAGLTLSNNIIVNGILALTSSDITTGTNTLTQPTTSGASTGTFDVVGTYQRTGSPIPNTALTYGNPNNVITLSGSALTSLSVQLTKGSAPASLPKAVQRSYVLTPTGSFTSASTQLHYLTGELNGNTESTIVITRFDSGLNRWLSQGAAARDTTNKWVQATGVTQFSTFTFVSPPSVTSINPNQGKTAGGDNVTINGSYFTGAGGVTIGGNALTNVSVVSDTQITGSTPAGTTGAASVVVNAAGGSNPANSLFTYIAAPTVTSISPTSGPAAGGSSVTITGTNFTGATVVTFGATAATAFTVNSATSIMAIAPAGSAGTVDVRVTTSGGTSATAAGDQFTYVAAPTVTSISPTSGPTAGGTSVTFTGTAFTGATAVKFGGTNATAFTVNSATSITATAPAGTGTVDIRITTVGGTSATGAGDQFTYVAAPTVTSISPTTGPTAGGTSVTITGTNFTGATAVTFGATPATSFTVNSGASITATAPTGSAGTVDVRITTTGGTSAIGAGDQFTYVAAPSITGVNPNAGPLAGGTSVAITGTNFSGAMAVTFGATAATSFTVNSATSITATSPAGTGTADIRIATTGGTSPTSPLDQFVYTPAPTVAGLSVTSGTTAGGTSVVLTGSNFSGARAVTFGATAATSFTVNSSTSIMATSPAGSGTVDVRVTTAGGTSATTTADSFTYIVPGTEWVVNSTGTVSRLNTAGTVGGSGGPSSTAAALGGVAIDNAGAAWAVVNGANQVVQVTSAGVVNGPFTGGGVNTPTAVAVDGAGMIWIANGNNSVTELTSAGAAVSLSTGYQDSSMRAPSGIAIDAAGSVWITNSGASTVTRIFGAAAPTVTPTVTGITNGTQGTKP